MPTSTGFDRHRRGALALFGSALAAPWLAGCAGMPPAEPDPADSRESAYRLVNRTSWGATDAELERCLARGHAAYLRQQLAPPPALLPAAAQAQVDALSIQQRPLAARVADALALRQTGNTAPTEDERKAAREAFQREMTRQARETASRQLLRALYSPAQLHEQMSWFWFNHFNVHQYKGEVRLLLADYEDRAIRPHALGSFRAMLGAVVRHPAMLQYLDNAQNAVGRPNENHARELLELHTLGVDGGYTQKDVQELARVLSGHGLNFGESMPRLKPAWQPLYRRDGFYEFNPARHDFGDKQLLGRTIRGRGADELDEVLDLLAAHPSTARFVAGKITRYLVADDPPADLVQRVAAAFEPQRTAPALGVLLRSPAFAQAAGTQFKDPMHFVISAVRAAHGESVVLNTGPMQNWLNQLGQGLYNRATPDGYPQRADAWSSSGQLAARFDVARAIGSGRTGLFNSADAPPPASPPPLPQLARPIYDQVVRATLSENTRRALDGAPSPQDWNTLYLAAPEFMWR